MNTQLVCKILLKMIVSIMYVRYLGDCELRHIRHNTV